MQEGDFYSSEKSMLILRDGNVSITIVGQDGAKQVLKAKTTVNIGEIIDLAVMSEKELSIFYSAGNYRC